MVEAIRKAEKLIGTINYNLNLKIEEIRKKGARSLFVVEDIKTGELITEANVRSIRPGDGMHPKYYKEVLGKRANQDLKRGTPLRMDNIK